MQENHIALLLGMIVLFSTAAHAAFFMKKERRKEPNK
jgi:hypothetical protein